MLSFRAGTLGDLAIASYLLAALSGVALAVPFDAADAYGSLATLILVNPAGVLFRNLHFWSGQAAFVLTLLHAWDHLRIGTERRVRVGVWARLVLALALIAFVMLSGFLLRGDADAQQALRILTEATTQIPVIGTGLATLVFGASGALGIVYVQHAATATIAVWLFAIEHSRRIWPRPAAFVVVVLAVGALSLVVSPGLHDGLDPIVKGPWYFLGLQEILHWTPWPVVAVFGLVLVLLAVFALRVVAAPRARAVKLALVALLVAYAGLCAVGGFMRGENWNWQAGWPGGTGNLRVGWIFAGTPGTPSPLPVPLPTVKGRPDGCLVCHRGVTGLGNAHAPDAVGCASCHGGDALTLDRQRAHAGIELIPGNLATAPRSCGQSSCHQSIIPRVERSVMTTMAGVVAVDRMIFGEPVGQAGTAARDVRALGHSPADTHLRQLCAICHLGVKKTDLGPNPEDSRGGGCVACHLSYDRAALTALNDYAARKATGAADPPSRHPAISLDIGNGQCFGCHSRSGRISTSYEGWHEMHDPPRAASDPGPLPSRYRLLADGRYFERIVPDIHHERGLDCIDCHTANEVMGDGKAHADKLAQLRVGCDDCHAQPGTRLASVPTAQLDPESRRLIALRGWTVTHPEARAVARSGEPLVNVVVEPAGRARMIRKRTGERRPLKPMAAVCAEGGGHERLSCGSCHSAWAPRCVTCHTAYDPKGEGYDALDDKDVVGAWTERAGPFVANPPTLGVRRSATPGGRESIDTFAPGMIMTVDRAMQAGDPPDVRFWRLFARVEPHTTRREARSCKSCHNDPEALGYGRGALRFERIASGLGRWTFAPAAAALPNDGLPADAWIPFLGARSGTVSTREDTRPFNLEEQRRVLTVGACLTCHAADSDVMRRSVRDFESLVNARTAACLVPAWK